MLMKCATCSKELITPRKNIVICSKCIIFEETKTQTEGAAVKEESENEQNHDEESESDEQNDDEGKQEYIEHQQLKKSTFMR